MSAAGQPLAETICRARNVCLPCGGPDISKRFGCNFQTSNLISQLEHLLAPCSSTYVVFNPNAMSFFSAPFHDLYLRADTGTKPNSVSNLTTLHALLPRRCCSPFQLNTHTRVPRTTERNPFKMPSTYLHSFDDWEKAFGRTTQSQIVHLIRGLEPWSIASINLASAFPDRSALRCPTLKP